MAFAPPRKAKSKSNVVSLGGLSTLTTSASTKIPVLSPAKQKRDILPTSQTTSTNEHGARVIPSRYMQSLETKKSTRVQDSKNVVGRNLAGMSTHSEIPQSKRPGVSSPSKSKITSSARSATDTSDTTTSREILSLRILQTMDTCEQGVVALDQLRNSAEGKLEARWEEVKQKNIQHQMILASVRMHDDVQELSNLSTSEIITLETFVGRLKDLQAESQRLVAHFEAWSQSPAASIDHKWKQSAGNFEDSCQSTRLTMISLLERADNSATKGVVCSAVNGCVDLLDAMRMEMTSLSKIAEQIWQDECWQIAKRYEALDLGSLHSVIDVPIWETI